MNAPCVIPPGELRVQQSNVGATATGVVCTVVVKHVPSGTLYVVHRPGLTVPPPKGSPFTLAVGTDTWDVYAA